MSLNELIAKGDVYQVQVHLKNREVPVQMWLTPDNIGGVRFAWEEYKKAELSLTMDKFSGDWRIPPYLELVGYLDHVVDVQRQVFIPFDHIDYLTLPFLAGI